MKRLLVRGARCAILLMSCTALSCGGGGSESMAPSVAPPETWVGRLVGADTTYICYDPGVFVQHYTITLNLRGGWVGSSNVNVVGSGSISGTDSVAQKTSESVNCHLETSTVSNVSFTLESIQLNAADQYFFVHGGGYIVPHKAYNSGGAIDLGVSTLSMWTTAIPTPTRIVGRWVTSGGASSSGNASRGTFEFTKQ